MSTGNNGGTTGRTADGRFTAGNPGRPRGARHRSTLAVEMLLDGEAEALTRKAIDLALEGDTTAIRLCLERVAPPRKDAPVTFHAPELSGPGDAVEAMADVVKAVAAGELTPSEGTAIAGLVEAYRRSLEMQELEARISQLEEKAK